MGCLPLWEPGTSHRAGHPAGTVIPPRLLHPSLELISQLTQSGFFNQVSCLELYGICYLAFTARNCFYCSKHTLCFIPVHARLLQQNLPGQDWSAHGQQLPDTALVPHGVHVPPGWLFWVPHGVASGQQMWPVRGSRARGPAPCPRSCPTIRDQIRLIPW